MILGHIYQLLVEVGFQLLQLLSCFIDLFSLQLTQIFNIVIVFLGFVAYFLTLCQCGLQVDDFLLELELVLEVILVLLVDVEKDLMTFGLLIELTIQLLVEESALDELVHDVPDPAEAFFIIRDMASAWRVCVVMVPVILQLLEPMVLLGEFDPEG